MADGIEDRISVDDIEDRPDEPTPVPVPVPVPAPPAVPEGEAEGEEGDGPVAVPPPPKEPEIDDTPISLVDFDDDEEGDGESRVKAFGAAAAAKRTKLGKEVEFTREVNVTGKDATRCKLFHSKISEGPMHHMQDMINDWMDTEGVEAKFVSQSIGIMEGKRAEPNVIVMVWY